jgi:H+-translocating NAD(P) transhydrogenase subunit alpha
VALVPSLVPPLTKAGHPVLLETGAGLSAGFPDREYVDKGATLAARAEVFSKADVVFQVRSLGANPDAGQTLIGLGEPLTALDAAKSLAAKGATFFALELIPRITRAQSMDVLSSMATVAGYKAVLIAAEALPRMFPMMMTAAGTISPAKVFVIGAGVAGLQAIASSRRLGAKVEAYDVRPAVKEQIQSLGAKFVELPIEAAGAEDKGGYAKAQDESFYQRQRELMSKVIAASDVVITTAAVPGKKAPVLVTADMVAGMRTGSVIVDLAAERGGNCELTTPGETVVVNGVSILGPVNLPATVPYHASQMFAKNMVTFFQHLAKSGTISTDTSDEIVVETLVTHAGEVVHPRLREALGLASGAEGRTS